MKLQEYLNSEDLFARNNGIQLTEVGKDYAKATMIVTENHKNAGNICQGGALFTLADFVFAALINSGGYLAFAINSNIYFHTSAQIGDTLTAEGRFMTNHPKVPSAEVVITNQNGTRIATLTAQGYTKKIPNPFV